MWRRAEEFGIAYPGASDDLIETQVASTPMFVCGLAISLVASMSGGCAQRGEPSACLDKRQRARNLALGGELEEASRLLEEVKAGCGPNSASDIQHIGKLIAERTENQQEQQRREIRENELRQKFPSRDFVAWATLRDGASTDKLASVTCAERGSPEFGFCEGRRSDAPHMSLRYWNEQRDAYRYALLTREPPSCQDLREYRQVRTWSRDGASYELCELTNRRLRHLFALLVQRPGAEHEMYIFSQAYLTRDPAFEQALRIIPPPR